VPHPAIASTPTAIAIHPHRIPSRMSFLPVLRPRGARRTRASLVQDGHGINRACLRLATPV
jgi:hypothetical protein